MAEGESETSAQAEMIERRRQVQQDISELSRNTKILTEAVNKNTERNEGMEKLVIRNQVLTIAILVLVLAIGALGWGNYQRDRNDNKRIEEIQGLAESNERLIKFIEDCVSPEGQCRQLSLQAEEINRRLDVLALREDQLQTAIDAAVAAGNGNTTGVIYRRDLEETRKEKAKLQHELQSLRVLPQ